MYEKSDTTYLLLLLAPSFAFVNVICLRGLLLIEHLIFGSKEKVIPLLMLAARGRVGAHLARNQRNSQDKFALMGEEENLVRVE